MSRPLHQINIQFRTKEALSAEAERQFSANLTTLLVGAVSEAGGQVVLTEGPLLATLHNHDAATTNACVGCLRLAQDGRG